MFVATNLKKWEIFRIRACVFGVVGLRREPHAGAVRTAGLGGGVVGAAAVPRQTDLEIVINIEIF